MITKQICSNVKFFLNLNTKVISKINLYKLPKLYKILHTYLLKTLETLSCSKIPHKVCTFSFGLGIRLKAKRFSGQIFGISLEWKTYFRSFTAILQWGMGDRCIQHGLSNRTNVYWMSKRLTRGKWMPSFNLFVNLSSLSVFKSEHHHLELLVKPKQNYRKIYNYKKEAVRYIFEILYLNKPILQSHYFLLIIELD